MKKLALALLALLLIAPAVQAQQRMEWQFFDDDGAPFLMSVLDWNKGFFSRSSGEFFSHRDWKFISFAKLVLNFDNFSPRNKSHFVHGWIDHSLAANGRAKGGEFLTPIYGSCITHSRLLMYDPLASAMMPPGEVFICTVSVSGGTSLSLSTRYSDGHTELSSHNPVTGGGVYHDEPNVVRDDLGIIENCTYCE